MSQFSHQIYKKVNLPFVKNLLIFIVLTVIITIMSGYALITGYNIKQMLIHNMLIRYCLLVI